MATTKTESRQNANVWVENIKTIVYAVLIAVGVRTFAFEPFNIPSGSMMPTLLVGDFLFVSKYSYGYSQFSLPFSPPLFSGRIFESPPQRGDVVVFRLPRDTSIDYIKRIIGLPGDRVQVKEGQLLINGVICPVKVEGKFVGDDGGISMMAQKYLETLPNGVSHDILKLTPQGEANNTPDYVVPPGNLFVMGDNRDNSLDSRFMNSGVGFLPIENLVGRAQILFFSIDWQYPIWQFWEWPFEVRWSRLLQPVR